MKINQIIRESTDDGMVVTATTGQSFNTVTKPFLRKDSSWHELNTLEQRHGVLDATLKPQGDVLTDQQLSQLSVALIRHPSQVFKAMTDLEALPVGAIVTPQRPSSPKFYTKMGNGEWLNHQDKKSYSVIYMTGLLDDGLVITEVAGFSGPPPLHPIRTPRGG